MSGTSPASGNRRVLILANPGAGRHADDAIAEAVETLEHAGCHCSRKAPDGIGELVETAEQGRKDYDIVVIAGGDGTIHAALPGLTGEGAPVGILPLGTANDLARTLDIPTDPAEAAAVIAGGRPQHIDLARFNDTLFVNVAHVGLGARAKQKVTSERKQRWRALSYPLSLLETLWSYRPFRVRITLDGETRRFWAVHVAIGNGRYSGGGVPVSEEADIADGRLDVCCVRAAQSWRLVRAAATVLRGSKGAEEVWRATGERVELETRHPHRITADGETAGKTPATFTIQPGAMTVIVPTECPMFRDEATVALNELLVQCETNAEHFRYTAELIDEPEWQPLLNELAQERRQLADALREQMRKHNELPDTADSELSTLQELGDTIASSLADWGRAKVMENRARDEQQLAELAAEALKHLHDSAYRDTVERIREQALAGAARLAAD